MNLVSTIGVALDIAGALILALGLLGKPATFALRATEFFGRSSLMPAALAEVRADAEMGIWMLVSGSVVQLAGQTLECQASLWQGMLGAAVVVGIALAGWRWLWRPWRSKRIAIEIAHYKVEAIRQVPRRQSRPLLEPLASMGIGLGYAMEDSEDDAAYVARVFGVADAIPPDQQ